MSNFPIVTLLESVLGKGRIKANNNVAFHCPFCHHHKPKLEVNTQSQHWHCWVCNAAGRKLPILFRRLSGILKKLQLIHRYYIYPKDFGHYGNLIKDRRNIGMQYIIYENVELTYKTF